MKRKKINQMAKETARRGKEIALTIISVEREQGVRVRELSSLSFAENNAKLAFVLLGKPSNASVVRGYYKKSNNNSVFVLAPSVDSPVEECLLFTEDELCGWFEDKPSREEFSKYSPVRVSDMYLFDTYLLYSSLFDYLRKLVTDYNLTQDEDKKKDIREVAYYTQIVLGEKQETAEAYAENYIKELK